MRAMTLQRSFAGGFYVVSVEGQELGIVQSVDGGGIKAELLTQPIGGEYLRVKNIGGVTIEPLTLEVGAWVSEAFYKWIADSWRGDYVRKDGSILVCDFDLVPKHEMTFTNALIVETTVPALDGSAKGPAYLTIKLQPETLVHNRSPQGGKVRGLVPAKQKLFQPQNFSFALDHFKTGNVTKVESFTIKQSVKPLMTGRLRPALWEPTSVEFPNLTITTALEASDDLFKWHKKFVVDGDAQVEDETTGEISFLTPDGTKSLLDIHLSGVGITGLTLEKMDAQQGRGGVKRVRAELYVTEMKFDYKAGPRL